MKYINIKRVRICVVNLVEKFNSIKIFKKTSIISQNLTKISEKTIKNRNCFIFILLIFEKL
jgi:hypothetical protein